jgi:hypothetical protein
VSDPCLFYCKSRTGGIILLFLFVDDMQGAFSEADREEWEEAKQKLKDRFEIKDLGESTWMLGMKISRDRLLKMIKLDQELYINKILQKYDMTECKTAKTPAAQNNGDQDDDRDGGSKPVDKLKYQELVGSLLYAAISTRPDISYAVHKLTKETCDPRVRHWRAAQRVLRYLAGCRADGLWFGPGGRGQQETQGVMSVSAFSDSDWAACKKTRRSVTGWIAMINGNPVSWSSKSQRITAQSSCEAELYAASAATNEVVWLRSLLSELELDIGGPSILLVDNQGTIEVSNHGIKSDRTKHVDIKYHHITETIEKGLIELEWVPTDKQQADIFTKALGAPQHGALRKLIMTHE